MRIDLFRSGSHTAMNGKTISFSEADVSAIASGYDAAKHEAPIVVGHPSHDAPAYGWVKGLSAEGGKLTADAGQVDPAFAELVELGRYKKVSASFYAPDSAANPTPGAYHLRHVGFLGAQPPSVKGLAPVEFADDDEGTLTIEFGEERTAGMLADVARMFRAAREWVLGKFGQEEADKAFPGWNVDWLQNAATREQIEAAPGSSSFGEEGPAAEPSDTGVAEGVEEVKPADPVSEAAAAAFAERVELDLQRTAFAESQKAARTRENDAVLEQLVGEGRLVPGLRPQIADFLEGLDATQTVEFGEGAQPETQRDFMLRLLKAAKPVIDFGEAAPAVRDPRPAPDQVADRARRITAARSAAAAAGQTLSFAEASARVDREEQDRT